MSTDAPNIRKATPEDREAIEALYPLAFPDEDLLPLLDAMWADASGPLMLVTDADGQITGHIAFSPCRVAGKGATVSLLGPLAVHPDHQRQGVGTDLIAAGLTEARQTGAALVLVLGDPAYYSRHGFRAEVAVTPPCPLPEDWAGAWQSLALTGPDPLTGHLSVPAYWQDPALWAA